jgi:hypothetical protein
VNVIDCQSLCGGSTEVCGQTVTCPSCSTCPQQTGCQSNQLPNGPLGDGNYCSLSTSAFGECTTNDDCAPGDYCAPIGNPPYPCARICPF